MVGSFEGDGGARKVDVRGLGARFLAGLKCCCSVVKAGLRSAGLGGAVALFDVLLLLVARVEDVDWCRAWRGREEACGRFVG